MFQCKYIHEQNNYSSKIAYNNCTFKQNLLLSNLAELHASILFSSDKFQFDNLTLSHDSNLSQKLD